MNVAGVYTIVFSVTNSQGMSASVNRTLAVEPICPSGETLCSNKVGFSNCYDAVSLLIAYTRLHASPYLMW